MKSAIVGGPGHRDTRYDERVDVVQRLVMNVETQGEDAVWQPRRERQPDLLEGEGGKRRQRGLMGALGSDRPSKKGGPIKAMVKSLKSAQSWSARKDRGTSAGSLRERLMMHAPRTLYHTKTQHFSERVKGSHPKRK